MLLLKGNADIELDVLHCLDRPTLEGLQMHSRYLRDFVHRHSRKLPRRYIHHVAIVSGEVLIQLLKDQCDWSMDVLSFGREDRGLPYYLREKADVLQCQIGVLRIADSDRENSVGIDDILVDFLGVHMKPQVYEPPIRGELREDYALLFSHEAMRGSVKHLVFELSGYNYLAAPECIIPAMFGVDVVDTCAIETDVDTRPWIGKFIKTFETAERGTEVVRSVTLEVSRFYEVSPLRQTVDPLGEPRRIDAPTPHSDFVKKWFREYDDGYTTTESTVAELFVFENATSAKKLEVLVWTIEELENEARTSLHYAFLI